MTTDPEPPVAARLAELAIAYERHEHPPVATVDEAERYWDGIDAVHCKNLFLRNQKGNRHYLVVLLHSKRADLRAVADQIGDGKLSFALGSVWDGSLWAAPPCRSDSLADGVGFRNVPQGRP